MPTPAQIIANTQNAQSSTGPRTPEGKRQSATNATRHGLSSTFIVLPHESQNEFTLLLDQLNLEFAPSGEHQLFLVEQMAQARWRLARVSRIEDAVLIKMMESGDQAADGDTKIAAALLSGNGTATLSLLKRYAAAAEKSYFKSHRELHLARLETLERKAVQKIEQSIGRIVHAPPPSMRNKPDLYPPPSNRWRPEPGENLALRL
jgi:hypothetical protein